MHRLIVSALAGAVVAGGIYALPAGGQDPPQRWYKGNTHTHTLNSDGDSTPDEVARWYREHGYQFVVLSDHNFLTSVDGLNALYGADEQFVVVRGEEVTDAFEDKPIHINGIDVQSRVDPQGGQSVVDVMQRNVDAIRAASGVPHINHPNFRWAITADELRQVRNNRLFEIFNGHPQVNNQGGGGIPGLEEVWDAILTSGVLLYGIAVDDAHVFRRPWDRAAARPSQGWIMVRAPRLRVSDLLASIARGDFYATTGVVLEDYQVTERSMRVVIAEDAWSKYRVQFIGAGVSSRKRSRIRRSTSSPATRRTCARRSWNPTVVSRGCSRRSAPATRLSRQAASSPWQKSSGAPRVVMRQDGKARRFDVAQRRPELVEGRRVRISGIFAMRSNAASRDEAPAECSWTSATGC